MMMIIITTIKTQLKQNTQNKRIENKDSVRRQKVTKGQFFSDRTVPDGAEADRYLPHRGIAEQIEDRESTLRTGHLFLHVLLQHLCIQRFSQIKAIS